MSDDVCQPNDGNWVISEEESRLFEGLLIRHLVNQMSACQEAHLSNSDDNQITYFLHPVISTRCRQNINGKILHRKKCCLGYCLQDAWLSILGPCRVCLYVCACVLYVIYTTSDCECEFMILRSAIFVFMVSLLLLLLSCHRYESADALHVMPVS